MKCSMHGGLETATETHFLGINNICEALSHRVCYVVIFAHPVLAETDVAEAQTSPGRNLFPWKLREGKFAEG